MNQELCENNHSVTKYIWKGEDPDEGVGFRHWRKFQQKNCLNNTSCEEDCKAKNGVISAKDGTCYAYKVLTKLCVTVGRVDGNGNDYYMAYDHGCYGDKGKADIAAFEWAKPGRNYTFDYVPLYVRHMEDPAVALLQ